MAVVTFNADVYPYCRGDVVNLTADEKKRVDAEVKVRGLQDAYSTGSKEPKEQKSETEEVDPKHLEGEEPTKVVGNKSRIAKK